MNIFRDDLFLWEIEFVERVRHIYEDRLGKKEESSGTNTVRKTVVGGKDGLGVAKRVADLILSEKWQDEETGAQGSIEWFCLLSLKNLGPVNLILEEKK